MAMTQSKMVELGSIAPDFTLYNPTNDSKLSLSDIKFSHAIVIMFICNHCPYVKHINKALIELVNDYLGKGIAFVGINSNDAENYPEDSPRKMRENALDLGYNFPYLYDETQEIAKNYSAVCTPDFFVYDSNLKLVYRGQLDDSRPSNGIKVTGKDIRNALEAIINNNEVPKNQIPSIGCNIKWRN